jgi:thiamine pyrophosphokinase
VSRALIITGHSAIVHPHADSTESFQWVIAADSGWHAARTAGWTPTHVLGDFDSVASGGIEEATALDAIVEHHRADKDASDGELALDRAVSLGATHITWANGGGGRLDHQLIELGLIAQPCRATLSAYIGADSVQPIHGPATLRVVTSPGATVSIVPMHGDATGLTTVGLRFRLDNEDLVAGTSRGLSNIADADECTVTITAGTALVIVVDGAITASTATASETSSNPTEPKAVS